MNFQKQDKLIQIAERYLRATLYPCDFLDTLSEKDRHYIIQNVTAGLPLTIGVAIKWWSTWAKAAPTAGNCKPVAQPLLYAQKTRLD